MNIEKTIIYRVYTWNLSCFKLDGNGYFMLIPNHLPLCTDLGTHHPSFNSQASYFKEWPSQVSGMDEIEDSFERHHFEKKKKLNDSGDLQIFFRHEEIAYNEKLDLKSNDIHDSVS